MDATVHMETIQIGLGCHGYLVSGAASIPALLDSFVHTSELQIYGTKTSKKEYK